jgi:putative methyltransferase (TIGR04325 family)
MIRELYKKLKYKNTFNGVYDFIEPTKDNIWIKDHWINISKEKLKDIDSPLQPHLQVITTFLNSIDLKDIEVLDYGGGTGFVYYKIFFYLKKNVNWNVIDNYKLLSLGADFKEDIHNIKFYESLDLLTRIYPNILLINTSLQYINNLKDIFINLVDRFNFKYIILTRVTSGIDDFWTYQKLGKDHIPFKFYNNHKIKNMLKVLGYDCIFDMPCFEEDFTYYYNKSIPVDKRINYTRNLIFKRNAI